jgi:hypothetical protein
MHAICLAMTTPRSGTTFLAHSLEAVYSDIAHVFHEDIQDEVA